MSSRALSMSCLNQSRTFLAFDTFISLMEVVNLLTSYIHSKVSSICLVEMIGHNAIRSFQA